MKDRISLQFILSALFVLCWAGCSSDNSHGIIDGTVTFDGAPLFDGLIRFIPTDGQTASADATIASGEFTAKVPVGEKRVTISAPKVVGKRKMYETPDSPTVNVVEELLPERYNVQSELMITVKPGQQDAEFPLTSGT
jgi:hypothetical protein